MKKMLFDYFKKHAKECIILIIIIGLTGGIIKSCNDIKKAELELAQKTEQYKADIEALKNPAVKINPKAKSKKTETVKKDYSLAFEFIRALGITNPEDMSIEQIKYIIDNIDKFVSEVKTVTVENETDGGSESIPIFSAPGQEADPVRLYPLVSYNLHTQEMGLGFNYNLDPLMVGGQYIFGNPASIEIMIQYGLW